MDQMEFVRIFLSIYDFKAEETFYQIIILNDFFEAILEELKLERSITYQDFLNFVTEVV